MAIDQYALTDTGDLDIVPANATTGEPVRRVSPRKSAADLPAPLPVEHRPIVETWAAEAIADGALGDNISDPIDGYLRGYRDGYARSTEEHGDTYSEGYAAGLATVAGHAQVWVKTRRRLDALRKGDVVLGKGGRWWIVEGSEAAPAGQWHVWAFSGEERLDVRSDRKRRVDVVEEIALADALAALKAGDLPVERAEVA